MLRKVLLVEDHDNARRLIGNFLSDEFEVIGAKNGLEAMTWLSNGLSPDVIVTDNHMPEMDGDHLIRQLRCTGMWSDIPVVVLGDAENSNQMSNHFTNLGACAFFIKPFSPLVLRDKLHQLFT
ncbi:MAG: response regulator [Saprospiraceae bacterium]|nr:response regulator [Saprospiraceae bacterium]